MEHRCKGRQRTQRGGTGARTLALGRRPRFFYIFVWGFTDIGADLLNIFFWGVAVGRVLGCGCRGRRQTQGGGTGAQTLALGLFGHVFLIFLYGVLRISAPIRCKNTKTSVANGWPLVRGFSGRRRSQGARTPSAFLALGRLSVYFCFCMGFYGYQCRSATFNFLGGDSG